MLDASPQLFGRAAQERCCRALRKFWKTDIAKASNNAVRPLPARVQGPSIGWSCHSRSKPRGVPLPADKLQTEKNLGAAIHTQGGHARSEKMHHSAGKPRGLQIRSKSSHRREMSSVTSLTLISKVSKRAQAQPGPAASINSDGQFPNGMTRGLLRLLFMYWIIPEDYAPRGWGIYAP